MMHLAAQVWTEFASKLSTIIKFKLQQMQTCGGGDAGGSLWCPNYVKLGWSKANLWRRGGGGIYIGRLLQYLLVPLQYLLVALSIFPLSPCYISFSLCPHNHLAASPPPQSAM